MCKLKMREARCAAYVKALQDAYELLQAHREALAIICDTLAVPDLAAARLLAAGALAEAIRNLDALGSDCWWCGADDKDCGADCELAPYRAAKEAEEAPDGQDA